MSPAAPESLPSKKHGLLWWIVVLGICVPGASLLLLLSWFCWQLLGPNPPIIVSRETTYITAPLGPDGLPDYERYVLEKYRQGITPENNAAVLLWQAVWPGELEPADYAPMATELGLNEIPSGADSLHPGQENPIRNQIAHWLEKNRIGDGGADSTPIDSRSDLVDDLLDRARTRSWTSEQIPPLANWIVAHETALELVVEASKRPRYYSPSPSLLDDSRTMILEMKLPGADALRDVARALSTRAMWNLGEGRIDDAKSDIAAVHRLARLACKDRMIVELLIAYAVQDIACSGTLALLSDDRLSEAQTRAILQELQQNNSCLSMADTLDHMERILGLDAVLTMRFYGPELLSGVIGRDKASQWRAARNIDWNLVLADMNSRYDRLVAALKQPTWEARTEASEKFEAELKERDRRINPGTAIAAYFSQKKRSQLMSDILTSLMMSALSGLHKSEARTDTQVDLVRIATALAVYRAGQGEYPDKLDQLVPDVLPKLPADLYNEQPFNYERYGDGYLLYSAGPNGVDDVGSNAQRNILKGRDLWDVDLDESEQAELEEQIPTGADDIAIRVPIPAFELPKAFSDQ